MNDIKHRDVTFTTDADGALSVQLPQYAGVQGEHHATTVVFTLPSECGYAETDAARLSFTLGDGTVLSSELIENVIAESGRVTVSYSLPRTLTQAGGQLCIRLVFSQFDENGRETVVWQSGEAVVYFDDASVENGTPFWIGVGELLKRTLLAKETVVGAIEQGQGAAALAQTSAQQAMNAANEAQTMSDFAQYRAELAGNRASKAQAAAARAEAAADRAEAAADQEIYVPKKGVDYYTEEDKEEMVNAVLAALSVAEGMNC